jgi:hypothetical protein
VEAGDGEMATMWMKVAGVTIARVKVRCGPGSGVHALLPRQPVIFA